jgi:hypothetical protein
MRSRVYHGGASVRCAACDKSAEINQHDERVVAAGFDAVAGRYGEVVFLRRAARALICVLCQSPWTNPQRKKLAIDARWRRRQWLR